MVQNGGELKAWLIAVLVAAGVLSHSAAQAAVRYAAATGLWNATATWNSTGCGNATNNPVVPGAADDVIICPSRTVTISANQSALTITVNNTGLLRMGNSATARTLTVSGNITINGGGAFDANPAFAATHVLAHTGAGNITNDGLINFANTGSGNNAVCNVTFAGWTGTRTVSGSGTSAFNRVTINSTSNTINDIIDVTASNFSLAAIGGNGINFTDGTLRLSAAMTLAPWAGAFTIPANSRLWLNDPGITFNYTAASTLTVGPGVLRIDDGVFNKTGNVATGMNVTSGSLQMNGGTLNVGSAVNNTLLLTSNAAATIQMTGGAINVAGRLASSATGGLGVFNLSGGTITVGTVGNTTNNALNAPFFIGSGVSYTQSGGAIEIQNANAQVNAREYDVRSTTSSITGGTLRIGNDSTTAGQTFQINSVPPLWNLLVVNNTGLTSDPTAILISVLTINNDFNIGTQTTLNANNLNISISGNWTTDGTFTPGTGTVTFAGGIQQTLSGAAASTTFYNAVLNNSNGLLLAAAGPAHNMSASNLLTLTSGRIKTGTNKVSITNGSAIAGAGASAFVVGNLGKAFATGSNVSQTFEVGNEIPVMSYTPILVTFASVSTAGEVVGSTTGTAHPDISNSGLDESNMANRYWTLTNNGVGSSSTYSATFNFLAGDLTAGATPASFIAQRYAPPYPAIGAWILTTTGSALPTSITVINLGITDFGDFAAGAAAAVVAGLGRFNMFEPDTPPGDVTGLIKTKIAGTTFYTDSTINLDIVALRNNGNLRTNYSNTVTVDLYDASVSTGTIDKGGCDSGWTYIQTIDNNFQFYNFDNGRKAFTPFAVAEAYPNVRMRIYQNNNVYGCSTDAFAIRPYQFINFSVTDGDWETAGPGRPLNSVNFGSVTHKAGRPFTVSATAINRAGTVTANYVGSPNGLVTSCSTGAACTLSVGAVSVGTNFTAGQLGSNSATYSEAGAFSLQLSDLSFAAIDAIGTLPSEREIASAVVDVGRFVPDHFSVAPSAPEFGTFCGSGGTGFTYMGQPFNYTAQPVLAIQAQNFTNAPTTLYTGSWWRLTSGSLTGKSYTAATGALDTSGIIGADPVINDAGSGSGSLTFSSGAGLFFTRATPVAPFDAEISLAINVIDADGVAYASNPASFGAASAGNGISFNNGKQMRFGRLRIGGASGSQLRPLNVQLLAQYWASTGAGNSFITNIADSCTAIAAVNIALGNYQKNLNACETSITAGSFASGRSIVRLSAPGTGNNGSVDLTANLGVGGTGSTCIAGAATPVTGANRADLQGNWSGGAYDQNPTARAAFGLYSGSEEIVDYREIY